jgi:hypothetical protein
MSLSPENSKWRTDIHEYYKLVDQGVNELTSDAYMMGNLEKLYPRADVKLSIENALLRMWRIEKGWEFKKTRAAKSKTARINMKQQIYDTIGFNLIDKQTQARQTPIEAWREEKQKTAEECQLSEMANEIGRLAWKLPNRNEFLKQFSIDFNSALCDGLERELLEKTLRNLKDTHPEIFEEKKTAPVITRTAIVNGDRNRELAARILRG